MLNPIQYEHAYEFDKIPFQWLQGFELFYPDLKNFPICYVHVLHDKKRLYGFPVEVSVVKKNTNKTCRVKVIFLCNEDQTTLTEDEEITLRNEIAGRFGLSNPLEKNDLKNISSDPKVVSFLEDLWARTSDMFGGSHPYGRLYEKMYSIVRFVSAWSPKTGRQSEMRMVYNFVSMFGEKIQVSGDRDFLDFFLIPTYDDVKKKNFSDFPRFKEMYDAVAKIWPVHYKEMGIYEISCNNHPFKTGNKAYTLQDANDLLAIKKATKVHKGCTLTLKQSAVLIHASDTSLGKNIDEFKKKFAGTWEHNGITTSDDTKVLVSLVSAFNRNPGRTSYFIWSLMSMFEKDYNTYDKKYYTDFYKLAENPNLIGISPKVVGCFLQQGFGMQEIIPIDTWVKSFHQGPLGLDDKRDFFQNFQLQGKFERMIWNVSQAKKTNVDSIINSLWCLRFGQTGNQIVRAANPLSCYACDLRDSDCAGYDFISQQKVNVVDVTSVNITPIDPNDEKKGYEIIDDAMLADLESETYDFVCITESGIPKKIFRKNKSVQKPKIELLDEFSVERITNNATISSGICTVADFIQTLGPNTPPSGAVMPD